MRNFAQRDTVDVSLNAVPTSEDVRSIGDILRDTRSLSGERLCCREANTARTGGSGNNCSFTRQKHIPLRKDLVWKPCLDWRGI